MTSIWNNSERIARCRHYAAGVLLAGLIQMLVVSPAIGDVVTLSQSIQLTLAPATKLSSPSSLTLSAPGGPFNNYSGNLVLSYKSRTLPGSSGATITVKANSEFTPTGGPTLASGALTYTCASATLGSGCSGAQTVSSTAQTAVVSVPAGSCTGGGGQCSAGNPNTVNLNFQLTNNSAYQAGTYSTTLMFSVSSL